MSLFVQDRALPEHWEGDLTYRRNSSRGNNGKDYEVT
jgi:hypothetical protein